MTLHYAGLAEEVFTYNEAALQLAIQYDREVEFDYPSSRGSLGLAPESRLFLPQVLQELAGNWVVTGHDVNRDDIRAFRVDRIVGDVRIV